MAIRVHRHVTGAAWLKYVQQELDNAGIDVVRLASGAVRVVNGNCRITAAELKFIDASDLRDLLAGRLV
jgi:recombinational DNA repair protein RecR